MRHQKHFNDTCLTYLATTITLEHVPIETVSQMLGHKKV